MQARTATSGCSIRTSAAVSFAGALPTTQLRSAACLPSCSASSQVALPYTASPVPGRAWRSSSARAARSPIAPSALPSADHATPSAAETGAQLSVSATARQGSLPRPSQQQTDSTGPRERWSLASERMVGTGRSVLLTSLAGVSGFLGSGFGLDGPGSTLSALGILALIVTIHECGHFVAARSQGIHVSKFAIGFGPALLAFKGKEVEYSLRLIPLGGYVAFPDGEQTQAEDGEPTERSYDPNDPNLLKNRSIPERAVVISAGVAANIVFAYFALLVQVSTVGKAVNDYLPGVLIPDVTAGSAAARAGFQNGDLVLTLDGWQVPAAPGQVQEVVQRIRLSGGREMNFQVQRDGTVIELPCQPDVQPDGTGRIGVSIFTNAGINHIKAKDVPDAFHLATEEFSRLSGVVANGLKQIVTNFSNMAGQLSGPVAIVAAGSEIARVDSAGLFQFCAIININLAAVNMLPLPALDGGYMLLLLIEAIRGGRKLPQELEQGFQASGLLLLTAMGMGLVVRDTLNLLL